MLKQRVLVLIHGQRDATPDANDYAWASSDDGFQTALHGRSIQPLPCPRHGYANQQYHDAYGYGIDGWLWDGNAGLERSRLRIHG